MWLNFKYRIANIKFGVIHGSENDWAVCQQATTDEIGQAFLKVMPNDPSKISYRDIRHIRMDKEPLPHGEAITGMFFVAAGENPTLYFSLQDSLGKAQSGRTCGEYRESSLVQI